MDQALHDLCTRVRTLPNARPYKPATYDDIREAEADIGVLFPEAYQIFLRHCNGGEFPFGKLHRIGGATGKGTEIRGAVSKLEESMAEVRDRAFLPLGELTDGRIVFLDLTRSEGRTAPVIEWLGEQVGEHADFEVFLGTVV